MSPLQYLRKIVKHNSPIRLWYTRGLAIVASVRTPLPKEMPILIGVTGTDGKTTTIEMIAHILYNLSIPAVSTSSYALKTDAHITTMSKRTTPSAQTIRTLIRTAKQNNINTVVVEVSSHSLVQWRVYGLSFDVAVLTNITHEHLNFHKTRENYALAKKLLFTKHLQQNGVALLPTNDQYGALWLKELRGSRPYTPPTTITDVYGTSFEYDGIAYTIPMLGAYNAGNALAAALAVHTAHESVSIAQCLDALHDFTGVPGRMQLMEEAREKGRTIIVDFAITEHAMRSTLASAREIALGHKVIVVFGASGGQHDASVHPGLAHAVAQGANIAIVTDDEPYDGDPEAIRTSLMTYIEATGNACEHHNIGDRRLAIRKAIALSNPGDVIVISGMGHYTSRTVHGKEVPWNDADVVREEVVRM